MSESIDRQETLDHLKKGIQDLLGDGIRVDAIYAQTPLLTEIRFWDENRSTHFYARVYRVPASRDEDMKKLWGNFEPAFKEALKHLPQKALGLKKLGKAWAYITADVPGLDLETYLQNVGPARPEFAVRIGMSLIRSLEKLKTHGCHHYQIQPSSIVITPEGKAVLKNLCIYTFERSLAKELGVADLFDGTYAAPEQFGPIEPSISTDIYQIGHLLYRIVTGQALYKGGFKAVKSGHEKKPLPNPQAFNKAVSVGFNRILMRALAKLPNQRFKDYKEFKTALGLLLPALERAEVTGGTDATGLKLKERDLEKVKSLLLEARQKAKAKDLQGALRTLDSVFVLCGYHGEAARLHQKIWEALYNKTVQKYYKGALARWKQGNAANALTALNVSLSFMPRHKESLELQTQIFDSLKDPIFEAPAAIDAKAFLGKAVELKSSLPLVAEALYGMVLMLPKPQEDEAVEAWSFNMQLAQRGFKSIDPNASAPAPLMSAPDPETVMLDDDQTKAFDDSGDLGLDTDFDDLFEDDSQASLPETKVMPVMPEPAKTVAEPPKFEPLPEVEPPKPAPAPTPTPEPPKAEDDSLFNKDEAEEENFFPEDDEPEEENFFPEENQASTKADEEEDLLGFPDTPEVKAPVQEETPKKPKSKLPIIIAAIALVLVLAMGGLFMKMKADKAAREAEAAIAYNAAEQVEHDGDLEGALKEWEQFVADYPEHPDGENRLVRLKEAIALRKHEIEALMRRATILLEAGIVYEPDSEGLNSIELLTKVLTLEPDHSEATETFDKIRDMELENTRTAIAESRMEEAQQIYGRLIAINKDFNDVEIEATLDNWFNESVVQPGLAKIDRAISRKKFEEARELSDELLAVKSDLGEVNARWNQVVTTYEKKLQDAELKDNRQAMLNALDVLVIARPDDASLNDRRDQLNRDLNLQKITDLERKIDSAMSAKKYTTAAKHAKSLQRLEKSNSKADGALKNIRNVLNSKINSLKGSNPRAALAVYDQLLSVSNWKSYRKGADGLRSRVKQFDAAVAKHQNDGAKEYKRRKEEVDSTINTYRDFGADSKYTTLQALSTELAAEDEQLTKLLRWESNASRNAGITYDEVLAYLDKSNTFKHAFGKTRVADIRKNYESKIANYDGMVTLVIRGASNIPKKGRRNPAVICELKTAGKTFTSEAVKDTNPKWNQLCTFKAKPGASLVLTVYEQTRKSRAPIGTVTLPKVPKSGKNLVLKPSSGSWSLTVDVRRER